MREHARHPRLSGESAWRKAGRTETGRLREQAITLADPGAQAAPWRRIELTLDRPSQAGERILRVWTNLPAQVSAAQIAQAYRDRWRIEGMFQRLERVLHSEITSLGHPRAALLGFGVALLAYNVLALIERCVERAQTAAGKPAPTVSLYHLALQVRSGYEGLRIALPADCATGPAGDPKALAPRLLSLARRIDPKRVAASQRKPKPRSTEPARQTNAHVATARVLANQTP
ncbi:transposase [Methylobacterium mesophilicum]